MVNSLFSALSGLKSHQDWIGVIGTNLANASTPGYKSSRATFADLFSQTLRFATLPTGTQGGRNPVQIGLGTQIADISRNMQQGSLANTGRPFDLALNGKGFFIVSDGVSNLYTRVGTFGLDASSRLVDQRTGNLVIGVNGQSISIDQTSAFQPQATDQISFAGNLPAEVNGPLAAELTSGALFEGTSASLTSPLSGPIGPIPLGETWSMQLAVNGGAPATVSITGTGGSVTTADVANAINALGLGATATDVGGALRITTDKTGADASIRILPGNTGMDLAAPFGLDTLPQANGTQSTALGTTDLNLLASNQVDYVNGDAISISGRESDGTQVNASFRYGVDGTTVDDLVTFIDGLFTSATASMDPVSGGIRLTADATGESLLSLAINETATPPKTSWASHAFATTTEGTGPDVETASIEVYDSGGTAHTVTFNFERADDGSWRIIPSIPSEEGTVLSPPITGLAFNDNGSISIPPSASDISIQFAGESLPQTVQLDFGSASQFDGVTQYGSEASVFADSQNGYGVGTMTSVSVNGSGEIQGFYSNGQSRVLGEIGIATFVNDDGLRAVGNSQFAESPNSGTRTVGNGLSGRAGEVVGGAIENSNVDIATEFVALIEAQRGFQANARLVTTTDEVLAELVNLI